MSTPHQPVMHQLLDEIIPIVLHTLVLLNYDNKICCLRKISEKINLNTALIALVQTVYLAGILLKSSNTVI